MEHVKNNFLMAKMSKKAFEMNISMLIFLIGVSFVFFEWIAVFLNDAFAVLSFMFLSLACLYFGSLARKKEIEWRIKT